MQNFSDEEHKKLYRKGYAFGSNPAFFECENLEMLLPRYNNKAFLSGFEYGRLDYERLNGKLAEGIPRFVLTENLLSEFYLLGSLGMSIMTDGYSPAQTVLIRNQYETGFAAYEPANDFELYMLLKSYNIDIIKTKV